MPMDLGTSPKDNSSKGNHEEVTAMKKPPVAAAVDVALSQRSPLTLVQTQEDHSMSNKPEAQPDGSESQLPAAIDPISQGEVQDLIPDDPVAQVTRAAFDIPANKGLRLVSEAEAHEEAWEGVAKAIENALPDTKLLNAAYLSRSSFYCWAATTTGEFARTVEHFPDESYMAAELEAVIEGARLLVNLFNRHAEYNARDCDSFKFYARRFAGVRIADQRKLDADQATSDVARLLAEIAQNSRDGSADGDKIADICNSWISCYGEKSMLFPAWAAGTWDESKHFVLLPSYESIESYIANRAKRVDGVAPVME